MPNNQLSAVNSLGKEFFTADQNKSHQKGWHRNGQWLHCYGALEQPLIIVGEQE
jgi:hypothetical protein